MHFDYEQASIAAIEYDLNGMPDDAQLAAEYVFMLELYRETCRESTSARFAAAARSRNCFGDGAVRTYCEVV
jgi:hypothetical protein